MRKLLLTLVLLFGCKQEELKIYPTFEFEPDATYKSSIEYYHLQAIQKLYMCSVPMVKAAVKNQQVLDMMNTKVDKKLYDLRYVTFREFESTKDKSFQDKTCAYVYHDKNVIYVPKTLDKFDGTNCSLPNSIGHELLHLIGYNHDTLKQTQEMDDAMYKCGFKAFGYHMYQPFLGPKPIELPAIVIEVMK